MHSPQDRSDALHHGMPGIFQFISVLQVKQYAKEPLAVVFRGVEGVDEDLPNRKLPLGQGVVMVPQAQLDPVLAVGAEGGKRGVLLLQALEEHAIFIAPNEQRIPGDEAQYLEFPERGYEILQLLPDDVVEGVEVGFALLGAADDSQGTKALQIVVDGIAGDARLLSQCLLALWLAVQPGEELHSPAGQDLR